MAINENAESDYVDEPWRNPSAKAYVRLDQVTKQFGDFTAVDGVNLDIYEREFFSLLGPSGCGKTTLLRLLAGFEQPTHGCILLDGEDVSSIPPYLRPVNMMFQSYALFPHMTVEKNIAFGLKQDGIDKWEIQRRVAEIMELVELGPLAKRKPHQLSGGQQQRVALARSLVKRPKTLLLDEPLGALDKKLREQTQFALVNIQEELGMTFIIVTHDQEEAMTMSTRIAVMDHGRIAQVATPTELYEAPNSRYVANFVGDVNLLEGRLSGRRDGCCEIMSSQIGGTILAEETVGTPVGSTVWVAVRPEKIAISKLPPLERRFNCAKGKVWDIGYLGDVSIYHVRLDNGQKLTAVEANRERAIERKITWEDQVWMSWSTQASVVLTN